MKSDMNTRRNKTRIDSDPRRTEVEDARRAVYESGVPVNAARIDDILKNSAVPTRVCSVFGLSDLYVLLIHLSIRTLSQSSDFSASSISMPCC